MSTDVSVVTEVNVLLENKCLTHYGISDVPVKECHENHNTSSRHVSHLAASDVSKYYWKFVDNGSLATI